MQNVTERQKHVESVEVTKKCAKRSLVTGVFDTSGHRCTVSIQTVGQYSGRGQAVTV